MVQGGQAEGGTGVSGSLGRMKLRVSGTRAAALGVQLTPHVLKSGA